MSSWNEGEYQLYRACKYGNVEEVKQLLKNYPHINTNCKSRWGETPFFISCDEGQLEVVKLLLTEKRVEVNKTKDPRVTPFYIACWNGHIEIVKLLLNDERVDVNQANNYGWTPFFIACFYGYVEIVKLLLNDRRVDVNKAENNGRTPFFVACNYGFIEVVEAILASGREIDFNAKDHDGKIAITIAREEKEKGQWESEEKFQKRKRDCPKIVEILESFNRNPDDIRYKLRIKLGIAGKNSLFFFFFNYNCTNFLIHFSFSTLDTFAVSLFTLIVLLSDDYFKLKNH